MVWHENGYNLVLSSKDDFVISFMSIVNFFIPVSFENKFGKKMKNNEREKVMYKIN